MELVNAASKYVNDVPEDKCDSTLAWRVVHDIVTMQAPICPHWAEELFHKALDLTGSVYNELWPEFDAEQAKNDMVEIAVQVKGKVCACIQVAADASKEELEAAARDALAEQIAGKTVKKVIVVPGRLMNIVAI